MKSTSVTNDGEVTDKKILTLNQSAIELESAFDGFYVVCTTLENDIPKIIKVNKRRWELKSLLEFLNLISRLDLFT